MSKTSENKRPGAAGHRFGPDLKCSECSISWEDHQRDPQPCERVAPDPHLATSAAVLPEDDFDSE